MIRIGILGDIGSGKTHIAKKFGYPIFDADLEVSKLYKKDKKTYQSLKKILPKYFHIFPIDKKEVSYAILDNKNNLNKIVKIIHLKIREKLKIFLKKNKNKKAIVLDIPLLLENKINNRKDILVYIESKRSDILKRLKKRKKFNQKLVNKFRNIQLPLDYKKKKSQFVIKNDFTERTAAKYVKNILNQILKWKK